MIKFIIEHTLAGGMIFQNTFEAHSIHISCLISWNSHRERIAGMDGLIIKREESWLGVKQNKSYSKSTMQSLIPAVVNDDFFIFFFFKQKKQPTNQIFPITISDIWV
jgi:hypothetical protein